MTYDVTRHVHIGIVGSGFAGLGAAILLKRDGIEDFLVFERAADVGGTWRDNSYPGCACDVESHLYSFSFAPNPEWSRSFSPQPEIYAYLRKCAQDFGVIPHMRFGHAIEQASWDETAQIWRIQTSQGAYTADFVISGMGALCEPALPVIPGIERFQGKAFHSARWDHDFDFKGKRVAVIGTGASAIQFVPELQKEVGKLTLFQRTPAWVLPRLDREISAREKALFRKIPALQRTKRSAIYLRREAVVLGLRNPKLFGVVEKFALGYLARCVPDPELRKKLTPNFRIGCKRILISSSYLPALAQPNVEVVTTPISEIREHSVVTRDGVEHEVDAIVFGTGFKVTEMPFAEVITGRGGVTLSSVFKGSPRAHLGTTVHGFPNLFVALGPNTGLGHTSVVLMIEAQLRLALETIKHIHKHKQDVFEVRKEAQARFNESVDARMQGTVWTSGGCNSWYLDATGRNSTLWPTFTFSFMREARFRPAEYVLSQRTRAQPAASERKTGAREPVLPCVESKRSTKHPVGKRVNHA